MGKDRNEIVRIISEMLDNPDEDGFYPIGVCYDKLERYIMQVRVEALGWADADACVDFVNGKDLQWCAMADRMQRALKELAE